MHTRTSVHVRSSVTAAPCGRCAGVASDSVSTTRWYQPCRPLVDVTAPRYRWLPAAVHDTTGSLGRGGGRWEGVWPRLHHSCTTSWTMTHSPSPRYGSWTYRSWCLAETRSYRRQVLVCETEDSPETSAWTPREPVFQQIATMRGLGFGGLHRVVAPELMTHGDRRGGDQGVVRRRKPPKIKIVDLWSQKIQLTRILYNLYS